MLGLARRSGVSRKHLSAAAFTPAALSQTKRWFWAGDISTLTTSGSSVTAWADKAGSSKPFTTKGASPTLVSSSAFGSTKAAIRATSGAGQALGADFSDMAGQAAYAYFLVGDYASSDANGHLISFSLGTSYGTDYNTAGTSTIQSDYNSNANFLINTNSTNVGTFSGAFATPYIFEAVFDGTNLTFYVNGTSVGAISQTAAFASGVSAALFTCNFNSSQYIYGDIRSLVLTGGTITTAQRQQIEGWASWDATGSGALLPTGHPYKSAAP